MHVRLFSDLAPFHNIASDFLTAGEPVTSLMLGVSTGAVQRAHVPHSTPHTAAHHASEASAPLGGVVFDREDGGEVIGALLRTGPFAALLSPMPADAAALLAKTCAAERACLPGVQGPEPSANAFARAWCEDLRAGARTDLTLLLHALRDLKAPSRPAPGEARHPTSDDRTFLVQWANDFLCEVHMPADGSDRWTDTLMAEDRLRIWYVDDEPVAMAGCTGRSGDTARIGAVYTPPAHRGRGYASHVTHALSAELLADGIARIVLYTDADNPTSNGIYRALGFEPVAREVRVQFTDLPPAQ